MGVYVVAGIQTSNQKPPRAPVRSPGNDDPPHDGGARPIRIFEDSEAVSLASRFFGE